MKNAIKRFLAVSCVVALFMTTPGVIVLADEIHEDISVSDVLDDNSIAPVIEESVPEVIEEEVPMLGTTSTSTKRYVLGKASFYGFCERHNLIVFCWLIIVGVFGVFGVLGEIKSFRPGRFLLGRFP